MAKLGLLSGQRLTSEEIKRSRGRHFYFILCIVATVCGLLLSAGGVYISYVVDKGEKLITVAVIGILLTFLGVLGAIASRSTKYNKMFMYIYGVVLITPVVLLSTVACFSFHGIIHGFVKHEWNLDTSSRIREMFCPDGTANRQCKAPYQGGIDFANTDEWCLAGCPNNGDLSSSEYLCQYNTTGCENLVDDAQHDAHLWLQSSFRSLGVIGIVNLLLLVAGIYNAIKLITVPLVMNTVLSVINSEMMFAVVLSFCSGVWCLRHK